MTKKEAQTINMLSDIVRVATEGLRQIQKAPVTWTPGMTPPGEMAFDVLQTMREVAKNKPADPIKTERLKDGEEIVFTKDFDVMFHKCCQCGLLHEVGLEWGDDKLTTRWVRRESDPTKEELERRGQLVEKGES